MQPWWQQRRYGLLVQASLSSVPAWAPIGESATWYRAHLGEYLGAAVPDTLLHASPMPETIDHHRRHWPHITNYDDFVDLLTFERFDPAEWADLAADAGMTYMVMTAKHYDGWCWWAAPGTQRRLTEHGPHRDVLAELHTACSNSDLIFGAEYSLLDWADERYPSTDFVDHVIHPQLYDLVDRYGIQLLYGRGHWGHSGEYWRSDELIDQLTTINPRLVLNDRFWSSRPSIRTIDVLTDWFNQPSGWELSIPVGVGSGYNQAVPDERLRTPEDLIATLTAVLARGGHLTVTIGCDASGQLAAEEAERLRLAGRWVAEHRRLVDHATPYRVWGDDENRYLELDGRVVAIRTHHGNERWQDRQGDHLGDRPRSHRRLHFPQLTKQHCPAVSVTDDTGRPVDFTQDSEGLHIHFGAPGQPTLADVFYIETEPTVATPISLFPDMPPAHARLADVLQDAQPGDVVQLGEGSYEGPALIPPDVTVRGLGPDRTILLGGTEPAAVLSDRARLEHCRVTGGRRIAWLPKTSVIVGGREAALLACQIDGHVDLDGALAPRIASCSLSGVVGTAAEDVSIVRSEFTGMGWDCAIDLQEGHSHLIESNSFRDNLQAIRLTNTVNATIRHNTVRSRWRGIHLINSEGTVVIGNRIEYSMRGFDVAGGTDQHIVGNAVSDGDSGCLIRHGASSVEVTGNHLERLRVGVMQWDAGPAVVDNNTHNDVDRVGPIVGPDGESGQP